MKTVSHLNAWEIHDIGDGRSYASGVCGDHYRLRPGPITTSEIVSRGDGWIETINTHFVLGAPFVPPPRPPKPTPGELARRPKITIRLYPNYGDPHRKPAAVDDDEFDSLPSWLDDVEDDPSLVASILKP